MPKRLIGKYLWKTIGAGKDKFHECIRWRVGDREGLSFWFDAWPDGKSLRMRFSQIFAIARNKDIIVKDVPTGN